MTNPSDVPLRRGHIVVVELDPALGAEQRKTRPAVIVSNDGANTAAGRTGYGVITVVPLTGAANRTGRPRPFQAAIAADESGLGRDCTAQAEQVRTISIGRVVRLAGGLGAEAMARLDAALRVHLAL
ncbi:MAG: type II toxin-antitoxin system PemK/MazF family toxin [Propionibacteriaceae bacterium]|jgi:mRNA interferase MazF|nr:type II toxin-antitoxin system PemK/MazF family toxin [Propionibacteriaceae bacterium]